MPAGGLGRPLLPCGDAKHHTAGGGKFDDLISGFVYDADIDMETRTMSTALFIVLEKDIPGFDAAVNGKPLSRASKGLDRIAGKLGVRPLMEFCSMDLGEAADLLADLGGEEADIPPEQWFDPEEGLRTVEALLTHLRRRTEARSEERRVGKECR